MSARRPLSWTYRHGVVRLKPFRPLFRSPHWQTIAGHYWRRPPEDPRFPAESRLFRTEPDVQVLVTSQRPPGVAAGEIVMVHGLEGSANSVYIRSLSAAALRQGFAAHRYNMRTCGGTEHLCRTLYHAGLTSDLLAVLTQLRAPKAAGPFSWWASPSAATSSSNWPAKWENVCGPWCGPSAPSPRPSTWPPARAAWPSARIWSTSAASSAACAPAWWPPAASRNSDFTGLDSVFAIDDRVTAPSFGFGTAEHYYRTQSAIRFLEGIRVPVLLIQAKDDTFIPFEVFGRPEVSSNPWIELLATEHGGHLGFIGRGSRRFWADEAIMDWIGRQHAKKSTAETSES